MAGSACGQGEANPVPWLGTRTVKMEASCPLRITHYLFTIYTCIILSKIHNKSFSSVHISHANKDPRQYPIILTWCLANNPYVHAVHGTGKPPLSGHAFGRQKNVVFVRS